MCEMEYYEKEGEKLSRNDLRERERAFVYSVGFNAFLLVFNYILILNNVIYVRVLQKAQGPHKPDDRRSRVQLKISFNANERTNTVATFDSIWKNSSILFVFELPLCQFGVIIVAGYFSIWTVSLSLSLSRRLEEDGKKR